jgi:nickel transport protein
MFGRRKCFLLVTILFAVFGPLAHAHDLHLFATVTDGVVNGKTYYADGPAKGVTVTVLGPNDEVLGTTESGEDGTFSWLPATRGDLRFVAESADGHREEFTIEGSELPEARSRPDAELATTQSDGSPQRPPLTEPPSNLAQLVEDAVSRQLRPLREQIDAAEHRTQLRDIVGGLGYIAGVAGLFAFWKSRSKRNGH